MALIKCKNCGAEISDAAGECPKCGTPIEKQVKCPDCESFFPISKEVCPNCGCPNKEYTKTASISKSNSNEKLSTETITSAKKKKSTTGTRRTKQSDVTPLETNVVVTPTEISDDALNEFVQYIYLTISAIASIVGCFLDGALSFYITAASLLVSGFICIKYWNTIIRKSAVWIAGVAMFTFLTAGLPNVISSGSGASSGVFGGTTSRGEEIVRAELPYIMIDNGYTLKQVENLECVNKNQYKFVVEAEKIMAQRRFRFRVRGYVYLYDNGDYDRCVIFQNPEIIQR